MPIPFCTQADLEIAVGGADRLLQLADFSGTGNINDAGVQTVISGWLLDGAAEVRSASEIKHDPETLANLDADSLRRLVDANAVLSGRVAFEKGTGGVALTEHLAARALRVDQFLDDLATGKRRLGRVAGGKPAAINQPAKMLDHDPNGQAVSVLGFRNAGFR